jgi:hypothetical protein
MISIKRLFPKIMRCTFLLSRPHHGLGKGV